MKRNLRRVVSSNPTTSIVVALLVVSLGALLAVRGYSNLTSGAPVTAVFTSGKWETYTSEKWGFSIDVPGGWEVYEGSDPYVPVVNVYVPVGRSRPPFDQSADVASVSLYPLGIKDTNIFSERTRAEATVDGVGKATETRFTLEDGSVWARQLNFSAAPSGWKPWGFVWARAGVSDLAFGCISEGAVVPFDACKPLAGDDVVRRGTLDRTSAATVERIMRSLRFPEPEE